MEGVALRDLVQSYSLLYPFLPPPPQHIAHGCAHSRHSINIEWTHSSVVVRVVKLLPKSCRAAGGPQNEQQFCVKCQVTLVLFEGSCYHLVAKRKKYTESWLASCSSSSFHCLRGQQASSHPSARGPAPATQKSTLAASEMEPEQARKWRLCRPWAGLPLGPSFHQLSGPCVSWPLSPACFKLGSAPLSLTLNLTLSFWETVSLGQGSDANEALIQWLPYENVSPSEVSLGTLTKTFTEIGWRGAI